MLTKMDDYPRHQAVATMAHVAVPHPSWNDGYWFSAWDPQGDLFVFTGMRVYQNADVMDGYACYTRGGRHVNVRVSRRYSPRYDDLSVGPLGYEIIEGLKRRRLRLDGEGHEGDLAFDLLWEAVAAPYEESRRTQRVEATPQFVRRRFRDHRGAPERGMAVVAPKSRSIRRYSSDERRISAAAARNRSTCSDVSRHEVGSSFR